MTRVLVLACAVALAAATTVAGCKKPNAKFCDAKSPCGGDRTCNLDTNECGPPGGGGGGGDGGGPGPADMAGGCACSDSSPICLQPACVACTSVAAPEEACAVSYPATPHCLTTGTGAGACVGCRDAADCSSAAAPACDATTHACRPCGADSECASQVCDLVPENVTTFGHCVDAAQIIYVDGSSIKKIQDGMTQAEKMNRLYVHIASGTYAENVYLDHPANLFLVGASNVLIHPAGGDAIGVSGGGNLSLRGIIATASGNGVNCLGSTSKVSVYRSQLINSAQSGIVSSMCRLTVDSTWIDHNANTGVIVAGSFSITNSVLTGNSGQGALQLTGSGSTISFMNNTVADNLASVNSVGCQGGSFTVVNSILYNNKTASGGISETSCPVMYSGIDDPSAGEPTNVDLSMQSPGFALGPRTAAYYRLLPTSPCRDKGTTNGAPDHDFDGRPRPDASHSYDIGAFEIQ